MLMFAIYEFVYCYDIPSIDLFEKFNEVVKHNNKTMFNLLWKTFKSLVECYNCKKGICKGCFDKLNKPTCSFCKYDVKQHMFKHAEELGVDDLSIKVHEHKVL